MSTDTTHPANCGVCTGYTVPAEYVALAQSHYSHHGDGLEHNLLAAVLPVALAEVTAERDRLLVALRSVHCELYEGTRDRALDIIDEALSGQRDGED